MRVVSSILLSIAIVGTSGQTDVPSEVPSLATLESYTPSSESPSLESKQSHSYIVNRLNSVFGEENCSVPTPEEFLDRQNTVRMVCYTVESPCFSGLAEYFWYDEEPERPNYLVVSYGYPSSSGIIDIDFSDDSDMEYVEPYLRSISSNTVDGVPISTNCSDGPSPQPVPTPTIASVAVFTVTPTNAPESTVEAPSNAPEYLVFEPVNPNTQSAKAQVGFVVSNLRRPKRVAPQLP